VTSPSGTSVGPTYANADELTFIPFPPEAQRAARNGNLAELRKYVPQGFTLDHVGNGGMWLRSTSNQYRPYGPSMAEAQQKFDQVDKPRRDRVAADQARQHDGKDYAWVDGKYVQLTTGVSSDGVQILNTKPVDGSAGTQLTVPTAFSALDNSSIDPTSPFLMSHYQLGKPAAGQSFLTGIFHAAATGAQGVMTIGNGVSWLADLATKDSGAYQAMLDKLHNANYLSDADYAAAAGHWSAAVGQAFALAARDVAVINATPNGANTTLDEFLSSKHDALANAKANAYTPRVRDYTDPEEIKAAARSAAQDLLGRRLTPEEESRLVGHFRGLEDRVFDEVDAAGRAGTGGSFTRPSESGQIQSFLDSGPLEQEQANWGAAQYGQALKALFSKTTSLTP
jgi:hypothetical protein